MQVTITIPDELATRMQARGVELSTYLANLMQEDLSQSSPDYKQRSEAVEAMLRFADAHDFTTGGQDLKSMIHEGHKR